MSARRVRVRRDARHIPRHHLGDTGEVVEERELSFGQPWLLLCFEDGCQRWVPPERVEAADG